MIDRISTPFSPLANGIAGGAKPNNLEQAAEKFEAMFLRTMLSEMRKGTDAFAGESGMFSSREARNLRDFYDDALAQELASQRSTGIANVLIQQLSPK
ncbi:MULTISPECIES: rod-binding protein [unclassified Pantoea]|jgi:flagellar protein FlgJ|uniref:rod-binding protein n=1 Tax=unclassified Pantoea TaxID=2630326 RepID=UPI0010C94E11|nr:MULTISPECIES: rod-binding protein [unclassified Pantoea]MBY4953628.1 rod-binding protein [Pantoea sp. DY-17]QCP60843.1 flagellar rod assembly protein/muramidase FlgJ [Pantoea sp. SO10]